MFLIFSYFLDFLMIIPQRFVNQIRFSPFFRGPPPLRARSPYVLIKIDIIINIYISIDYVENTEKSNKRRISVIINFQIAGKMYISH